LLVAAALLAAPAPGYLAGQVALVRGLLRVRPQRSSPGPGALGPPARHLAQASRLKRRKSQ